MEGVGEIGYRSKEIFLPIPQKEKKKPEQVEFEIFFFVVFSVSLYFPSFEELAAAGGTTSSSGISSSSADIHPSATYYT